MPLFGGRGMKVVPPWSQSAAPKGYRGKKRKGAAREPLSFFSSGRAPKRKGAGGFKGIKATSLNDRIFGYFR